MTRWFCGCAVALVFLVASSTSAAQTGAARIGELVKTGQKIAIVDDDGRELQGRVSDVSANSLGLVTDDGPIALSLDSIVKIDHPRDGLGNGALIGMTTLVGLTLIGHAVNNHSCSGNDPRCTDTPPLIVMWATGSMAAFGAGLGVAVDAMIHRRDRSIYRRGTGVQTSVGPAFGRGVRGAVVSVSW